MKQANLVRVRVRLGRTADGALDTEAVFGEAVNDSTASISDVTMIVRDRYQSDVRTLEYLHTVDPTAKMSVRFGRPRKVDIQSDSELGDMDEMMLTMDYFATVIFTDAAGLRWERTGHSSPTRHASPALVKRGGWVGLFEGYADEDAQRRAIGVVVSAYARRTFWE